MIHFATIERSGTETRYRNRDETETTGRDDGLSGVSITAEQHFGIRVFDRDGQTWIELREGGDTAAPMRFQDAVRALRSRSKGTP